MSSIDTAIGIAVKAHKGQTDRDGEAYILHPLAVGLMGKTDEERMAGFLHDVLEDSDITVGDMLEAGIPESVVNALKILTHDKSTPYNDYIRSVIDSRNPIALKVKFNDLTHNYNRGKNYPDLQQKHGAALKIVSKALEEQEKVSLYVPKDGVDYAIFAAGCFWGVQHYLAKQAGVLRTFVGYTGGSEQYPTYEEVRSHRTTHLEAVLVEYDSAAVSFDSLCRLFFEIHDPAQTDGQGPDIGSQYLSGVFYTSDAQLRTTESLVDYLRKHGYEVNSRIEKACQFWIAEQYHQNYYENTGGSPYCHIRKKKFKE